MSVFLVLEGTLTGEDHGHLRGVLVDGLDDFPVTDGAAGLADGGHALSHGHIHAVAEGEEAVGDDDRTGEAAVGFPCTGLNVGKLVGEPLVGAGLGF